MLAILNIIFNIPVIIQLLRQTQHSGFYLWTGVPPWLDATYSILNIGICILIIMEKDPSLQELLRIVEASAALAIWLKSFYFLQLYD